MTRKMMKNGFQVVVALALVAYATLARAEAPGPLEVAVATGFTRGHGPAAGEMMPDLQDLAGNGASVGSTWARSTVSHGTYIALTTLRPDGSVGVHGARLDGQQGPGAE